MFRKVVLLTVVFALALTFALPIVQSSNDTQAAEDGVAIAGLVDFSDHHIIADPECPKNGQGTPSGC